MFGATLHFFCLTIGFDGPLLVLQIGVNWAFMVLAKVSGIHLLLVAVGTKYETFHGINRRLCCA